MGGLGSGRQPNESPRQEILRLLGEGLIGLAPKLLPELTCR